MAEHTPESIELETPDGPMAALRATPDGEIRGGVVVVQEAFGLTGHIGRVCGALAADGWLAVAPALYHRAERQVFGYDDRADLAPAVATLSGDGISTDVDVALAELERLGQPAERTGIIGFCMGGGIALATAARVALGAAVTFYGGGIGEGRFGLPSGLESARHLRTPWLGLYGDLDAHIPVEEVEQLRAVVAGAGVDAEVVRYPDADHGFHCDERAAFHPATSADAWARTIAFLGDHLH